MKKEINAYKRFFLSVLFILFKLGGFGGFGTTSTTAGSAFSFSAPANTGATGKKISKSFVKWMN